ncbi:MAG: Hsp20/alpha crystallin family protein [Nitrospirota bacterium]|nr:Hsp20/alpha crystallin family protein [Nitrospirota bacterium]
MGNLIHFGRRGVPVRTMESPLLALREEVDRLFDSFWGGWPMGPLHHMESSVRGFTPRVDMVEKGTELLVSAELPGMEEKDLDITLTGDTLTIRGEKKAEETMREEGGYTHTERFYGSFQRTIPLPCEVQVENAVATFKTGVLTVTLPKAEAARVPVHKVEIKKAA